MGLWTKIKNLLTKGKWEDTTQTPTDQLIGTTTIQPPTQEQIDTQIDSGETPIQPQTTLPTTQPTTEPTPKTPIQQEQENIEKSLKDKPTTKKINQQITPEGVTRTERQTTLPTNLGQYRPIYQQLLSSKVQDPELIDAIIAGREHIRHRFTTELYLEINGGEDTVTVTIPGLLPEQTNTIYHMIERLKEPWDIEYFNDYLNNILQNIKAYNGGHESTHTHIDIKTGRITNITHQHTFA